MNRPSSYFGPTKVKYGRGAVSTLREVVAEWKRPLIVTSAGLARMKSFGTIRDLVELGTSGSALVFDEVVADPPAGVVTTGAEVARRNKVDVVIAVGGGSAIDTAKGIAVAAKSERNILDYVVDGHTKEARLQVGEALPVVAVPTTAGTGSEVTMGAVISDSERHTKEVIISPYLAPRAAVVDPELTLSLPHEVTASAGMDALCQGIEAYISANSQPITDTLALEAVRRSASLRRLSANPQDIHARADMSLAATLSGFAIANAGTGAVHAVSMVLGGRVGLAHGLAISVVLVEVLEYNFAAVPDEKLIALGSAWLGRDVSAGARDELLADFDELREMLGLKRRLRDVGVSERDLEPLAVYACEHFDMLTNPRAASPSEMQELLESIY